MNFRLLFYVLFIVNFFLFCSAAPTRWLSRKSKKVEIKPPPKNADLSQLASHHAQQRLEHQKKSKSSFRSASNKEAHAKLALAHKEEALKAAQQVNRIKLGQI